MVDQHYNTRHTIHHQFLRFKDINKSPLILLTSRCTNIHLIPHNPTKSLNLCFKLTSPQHLKFITNNKRCSTTFRQNSKLSIPNLPANANQLSSFTQHNYQNPSRNHTINHSPLPHTLTYVHYFIQYSSLSSNDTLSLPPSQVPKNNLKRKRHCSRHRLAAS